MTHGDIDIVPLICFRFNITSTFGGIKFHLESPVQGAETFYAPCRKLKKSAVGAQPQFADRLRSGLLCQQISLSLSLSAIPLNP